MNALLVSLLFLTVSNAALAQVQVTDPWVRGTVPGQHATGAFMKLVAAVDTALVQASSPAAEIVEIHQSTMEGTLMKMRSVERVPLRAGKGIDLEPGGYHLMLMSLRQPAHAGDVVLITLTFEDASGRRSTLEVKATVAPLTGSIRKHNH